MKPLSLLFIVFLTVQYGHSQDSIIRSKTLEKEGWGLYFNNQPKKAKDKFRKALEVNRNNNLAKVGLLNCLDKSVYKSMESLVDYDSEKKDSMQWVTVNDVLLVLMLDNITQEGKTQKEIKESRQDDSSYKQLKYILTEEPYTEMREDGSIWRKGQFKNLKPIGKLSIYSNNNKIISEYIYPETGDTIIEKHYTDKGYLAREIITKGDPLHGTSYPIKETIYWQENGGGDPKYLFVSKSGFVIYDLQNPVNLDETTPDNLIENVWDGGEQKTYIWKNGKRVPYEFCPEDGYYMEEKSNGVRIEYRWDNCEKTIIKEYKIE